MERCLQVDSGKDSSSDRNISDICQCCYFWSAPDPAWGAYAPPGNSPLLYVFRFLILGAFAFIITSRHLRYNDGQPRELDGDGHAFHTTRPNAAVYWN